MIELMIGIGIMGILSAVFIPTFSSSLKKSRDAKRKGDIASIQTALESYYTDTKTYPSSISYGSPLCHPNGCSTKVYMDKIPADPGGSSQYVYETDGAAYALYSCIENSNDQGKGVQQTGYEKNCGACGACKFSPTGGSSIIVSQPTATPVPQQPTATSAPQQPTATPIPQQPTATPIPLAQYTTAYRDEDNDGYTVGGAQQVALQNGSLPSGWKSNPSAQVDCDDNNNIAYPDSNHYSPNPRSNGSWDFDCDGQTTKSPWHCQTATGCSLSGSCYRCAGYTNGDTVNAINNSFVDCGQAHSGSCYIEYASLDCSQVLTSYQAPFYLGTQGSYCFVTNPGNGGGLKSATWSPTAEPRTCICN